MRVRGREAIVDVRFYGVRGSTPCSHEGNRRYGGNTSCVVLEREGHDPIVFDLGTGLRFFGDRCTDGGNSFHAHALVTHLHWDHVQGLPFCPPLHCPGARLDIYGPASNGGALRDEFCGFMRPPYFPVGIDDLAADVAFHNAEPGSFMVGDAMVTAAVVPHTDLTLGYRVELDGVAVVYIPDHQQPLDGSLRVSDGVLALADGADLLIHDAQFTQDEFSLRPHWGHSTVEFAVHVAREAGVRRLALFHHDPCHDDAMVDSILDVARASSMASAIGEIVAASEGMTIPVGALVGAG